MKKTRNLINVQNLNNFGLWIFFWLADVAELSRAKWVKGP